MYTDLKEKTALITGSGKTTGIGYAIARRLASNGVNVVIADLGVSQPNNPIQTGSSVEMNQIAADLGAEFGVDTLALGFDVTENDSIALAATEIQARFGQLDILCNNAGASFGTPNAVHTYDEAAWMKTIDVNLHSVFKVSRGMLPLMTAKGGSIINVASRAGKVPPLFNGAYAVAKAGVIMLTKVMAKELAGQNIRLNSVCPGQIMTDLERWRFGMEAEFFNTTVAEREQEMCKTIPLNRIGEPEEVAKLVVYLASAEASYLTGQAINVTGGQLMEL